MTPAEQTARLRALRIADALMTDAAAPPRPAARPVPHFDAVIDRAIPRPRPAVWQDRAAAAGRWLMQLLGWLLVLGVTSQLLRGALAIWRGAY